MLNEYSRAHVWKSAGELRRRSDAELRFLSISMCLFPVAWLAISDHRSAPLMRELQDRKYFRTLHNNQPGPCRPALVEPRELTPTRVLGYPHGTLQWHCPTSKTLKIKITAILLSRSSRIGPFSAQHFPPRPPPPPPPPPSPPPHA